MAPIDRSRLCRERARATKPPRVRGGRNEYSWEKKMRKREKKGGKRETRRREHSRDERRMRRNEARSGTVGSTNGGTTTAKGNRPRRVAPEINRRPRCHNPVRKKLVQYGAIHMRGWDGQTVPSLRASDSASPSLKRTYQSLIIFGLSQRWCRIKRSVANIRLSFVYSKRLMNAEIYAEAYIRLQRIQMRFLIAVDKGASFDSNARYCI